MSKQVPAMTPEMYELLYGEGGILDRSPPVLPMLKKWTGSPRFSLDKSPWTGMSSKNLSVTLRHWCGTQPDEFVKPAFTIRARDEAQAVETWNRRAPIQPLKGE